MSLEIQRSSDSSSGTNLDTASTNTGPMGAEGDCGSEDANQSKFQLYDAKVVAGNGLKPQVIRIVIFGLY